MANAKQCDICGVFYAALKSSRARGGFDCRDSATLVVFDPDPEVKSSNDVVELETCPECMSRVKAFIGELRKENK